MMRLAMRRSLKSLFLAALLVAGRAAADEPLPAHESFTIESAVLKETRRINVYTPPGYAGEARFPVLYMPDGGMQEDFPHLSTTIDTAIKAGEMRPVILVGIENTERRRDVTGPTEVDEDRKIAPRVGGSAAFRRFLRDELMPEVRRRYRTAEETGQGLADDGGLVGDAIPPAHLRHQLVAEEAAERGRAADPRRDLAVLLHLGRTGHVAPPLGVLDADHDQRPHLAGLDPGVDRGGDVREILLQAAVRHVQHGVALGSRAIPWRHVDVDAPGFAEDFGFERERLVGRQRLFGRCARDEKYSSQQQCGYQGRISAITRSGSSGSLPR
jgi:hypothetical protein